MERKRDEKGHFLPGVSGNPAGRPKKDEVSDRLYPLVPLAVERIRDILENPKAAPRDLIKAAELVLSRVYGLPRQSVDIDATDTTIRIIDTDPEGADFNG